MSIIPRNSPLNLQYRICIVTSASSALGTVVCKTLLKANALVLGIDDRKQDNSLSSAPGTHFQYLQSSTERAAEQMTQAVAEKFEGSERVDVLVCLGHGREESTLAETVGGVMGKGDGGSIVHILEDGEGMDEARRLAGSSHSHGKLRCNLIVPADLRGKADAQPAPAFEEAKEHMRALVKTEKYRRSPAFLGSSDILLIRS
ncbi:hypothetical protein LTR78_004147 [Recurvomyces mirabilis]|uniref:Uncharacterized protein n=1 Tax=Recurvomyces mirabilis TaxID=574656 RepID=A0AAE1C2Q8_9PEZI|nr:hypothetical protein LTR78_004147 [Recurvomyces mirabilis]KAK5153682.1 hypothetical protein LTS14_007376 [Recurvomyces mirabilis]